MITVICDHCGHEEATTLSEAPTYHNLPCPKCEHILVNDEDMRSLRTIQEAQDRGHIDADAPSEEAHLMLASNKAGREAISLLGLLSQLLPRT